MKKKYYFVAKTVQGEVVNLVSKGKDLKHAEEKLLNSLKNNIKEILSASESYPNNHIEIKEEVVDQERMIFYTKDKTRRNIKIFS